MSAGGRGGLTRINGGRSPPQGHRGRGGRGLSSAKAGGYTNGRPTAKAELNPPSSTPGVQFCIAVAAGDVAVLQRESSTVHQFVDSFVAKYNKKAAPVSHKLAVDPLFEIRQTDIGQVMCELKTRIGSDGMPKICLLFAGGNKEDLAEYKVQIRDEYRGIFVVAVDERKLQQPKGTIGIVELLFRNLKISENKTNPASRRQIASGGQHKTQPMQWKNVHQLSTDLDEGKLEAGSADLIQRLIAGGSFVERLSDTATAQPDSLSALMHLAAAVCSCTALDLRPSAMLILTELSLSGLLRSAYEECVAPMRFSSSMPDKERERGCRTAVNLAVVASALIDRLPTGQVLTLAANLQLLPDVGREFEEAKNRLTVQMNAPFQKLRTAAGKSMNLQPPENFRQLSIIPTGEDILAVKLPYLRKNKTEGAYDNTEHYLDVQFRLLREDYLHDMREGIKRLSDFNKDDKQRGDLMVYEEACISRHYVDSKRGAIVHPVDFRPKPGVRWQKRMLPGSLVCLSNDCFRQNLIFAVVFDRFVASIIGEQKPQGKKLRPLEDGHIVLKFENALAIEFRSAYQMIESPAYFEAYRPVLQSLQDVRPGKDVPFHQYLVANQVESVMPPMYLRQNPPLDFFPLLPDYKPPSESSILSESVVAEKKSVKSLDSCYSPKSFQMDESQFAALKTVLSNEVAVIQGPPGTGITWIGYKIVKLLLVNERVWNRQENHQYEKADVKRPANSLGPGPILVVCYTNHALDQFLEGIADMTQEIVRCGGRSESEKLEPFLLRNVRLRKKMSSKLGQRVYQMRTKGRKLAKQLESTMAVICRGKRNLPTWLEIERHVKERLHKRALKQEGLLTDWLTTIGRPVDCPKELFNPSIIRELMTSWEIDEMSSRVAAYQSGNRSVEEAINYLHSRAALGDGADAHTIVALLPPCPQVEHLPRIAAIDKLMAAIGCTEENAIVALIRADNDEQRATELIKAEFGGVMPNAPPVADRTDNRVAYHKVAKTNDLDRYIKIEDVAKERDLDEVDVWQWDRMMGAPLASRQTAAAPDDVQWAVVGKDGREVCNTETAFTQQLLNRILCAQPMIDAEEKTINDIWGLPLHRRWQLFALWLRRYQQILEGEYGLYERRYIRLLEELGELYSEADYQVLKRAKVIGMTTTGAARLQETLRLLKPPIVIVEEAAELFEASVLTSITQGCEHLILIGDHKQLRPKPAVYHLGIEYHLDVSLFERIVNNGFPYAQLKLQHRMRPQIRQPLMTHFYTDLKDDESVSKYPDVVGMGGNLLFFNHQSPEEYAFADATSPRNMLEARFSVVLALYLLQQDYEPEKITILCCYMEQMLSIRKLIDETVGQSSAKKNPSPIHALLCQVRVVVVDNYQGEENDVIILSLVRSSTRGKIGFISVENRACVALSRARHGMFVFGNFHHLSNCVRDGSVDGRTNWPGIVASAKEGGFMVEELPIVCASHGKLQKVASPTDFAKLSPEGGCLEMCGGQLGCEHPCEKLCHAYSHDKVACLKPCKRVCQNAQLKHPCRKRCYEDCGDCHVRVDRKLKCGHSQLEQCFREVESIKCKSPCDKELNCGHKCKATCGDDSCITDCQELIIKTLRCGHKFKTPCCADAADCQELIPKTLPCGHKAQITCSTEVSGVCCREKVTKLWRVCCYLLEVECHVDPEKSPCPSPCATLLPCGHVCKGKCGACFGGRLHIRCAERCQRMLVCGHACRSVCSQTCPPCEQRCENACAHTSCSSKIFGQPNSACNHQCPSCVQPCANNCEHRQCERACGELCNVGLCNERCQKKLACGHPCVGICGDVCPTTKVKHGRRQVTIEYCRDCVECKQKCGICRSCRSFKAFQQLIDSTFYGTEKDKEAMFVQLPDCKHVFESTGLDKSIKEPSAIGDCKAVDGYKIIMPSCPKCRTPIRRSIRYTSYINRSNNLLEKVKSRMRGGGRLALDGQLNALKMQLTKQLQNQTDDKGAAGWEQVPKEVEYDAVEKLVSQFLGKVKMCDPKQLTAEKLQTWQNVHRFLTELKKRHTEYKVAVKDFVKPSSHVGFPNINEASAFLTPKGQSFCALRLLTDEWEKLMAWLKKTDLTSSFSNLMMQQLAAELCRLRHLTQFSQLLHGLMTKKKDVKTTVGLAAAWKVFFGSNSIQNTVQDELLAAIKACVDGSYQSMGLLPSYGGYLFESEQIKFTQPIGMSHEQWCHCKNGNIGSTCKLTEHVYAIDQCVQAVCPECVAD